jgi:immune inhibitor A
MKKPTYTILIVTGIILGVCCCALALLSGVSYVFLNTRNIFPTIAIYTPFVPESVTPTPFVITRQPVDTIPTDTFILLKQVIVQGSDLYALACRFQGICNIPTTLAPPDVPYTTGRVESFWVNNEDTHSYFQVNATLRYITPHVYFWVESNANYDQAAMQKLVDAFEEKIYPTDREFFGSEWTPGVDGDPHIYILYTSGLGSSVAGYYSSPDEYNPLARKYSNAHEMFYINTSQSLSADYTYGSLAHEFQHMIHWYQDSNESTFLNEGFSELATFLNGYDTGSFDSYYISNPDMNLTDWLGSAGENSAHYGASFLFVTYFLDRFGEDSTKALIHNQENGLESIDSTLAQNNISDPLTGAVISADDFFLDWTIANYIQDGTVGDGRYVYHKYSTAPQAYDTESIGTCPVDRASRTVN